MRTLRLVLLAACLLAVPVRADIPEYKPPTEQEVALMVSVVLRVAEERDQAREDLAEAKQEIERLQRQIHLFCMRAYDL